MMYNLLMMKNFLVIKPACDGLNNSEFDMGARIRATSNNKWSLETMVNGNEEIIDIEEWRMLINGDTMCHARSSVSKPVFTEKYDRGPYSKYWHK